MGKTCAADCKLKLHLSLPTHKKQIQACVCTSVVIIPDIGWICTVNLSYLFQQVRSVTYHLPVLGCVLKQTMMEDKAGSHMWKICWTYNVSDVERNKQTWTVFWVRGIVYNWKWDTTWDLVRFIHSVGTRRYHVGIQRQSPHTSRWHKVLHEKFQSWTGVGVFSLSSPWEVSILIYDTFQLGVGGPEYPILRDFDIFPHYVKLCVWRLISTRI